MAGMRSAWLKWARGVEHGKELSRATREYMATSDRYEYVRFDNAKDSSDPFVRMHWVLRTKCAYPERWSVLLADTVANLRAALDHAFWHAAVMHSGQPSRPSRVMFPICSTVEAFRRSASELKQLVDPQVWDVVTTLQPLNGGDLAHTDPLEILRWLSNVDKHRSVHVVGSTFVDLGPALMGSVVPLEVIEHWAKDGQVEDGDVVARLKVRRPRSGQEVDLVPTFAHMATVQISEKPVEVRSLHSAINVMNERVLHALAAITDQLGLDLPDTKTLEMGSGHDAVRPDTGGDLLVLTTTEGEREVHRLSPPPEHEPQAD